MPVTNDPSSLKAALLTAIRSQSYDPAVGSATAGLSGNEVDKLLKDLKADGVTDAEVGAVVDGLVEALKGGYDVAAPREQKNIARLLDTVDKLRPGVIADKAQFTTGTSTAWGALLRARANGGTPTPVTPTPVTPTPVTPSPTTPVTTSPLPKPGFDGTSIAISTTSLTRNGAAVALAVKGQTDGATLLSLLRPGQLAAVADKPALAKSLVAAVAAGLPLDPASTTKFHPAVAAFALLGASRELAGSLSAADVDVLAGLVGKTPSATQEAVLLSTLAKARDAGVSTSASNAALAGFPSAAQTTLLDAIDRFRGETGRVGYTDVKGDAASTALACLAFAKDQTALDNIGKGLEAWSKMEAGYGSDFSTTEAKAAFAMLEPYINAASATNLVFGAFAQDTPKAIATAQAAQQTAKLEPLLTS
ncbi:MAG TPA: hypothetical protein VGF99_04100, partial [Myxococcota bacterium]